jgi:uncharacterized integral membrane protein
VDVPTSESPAARPEASSVPSEPSAPPAAPAEPDVDVGAGPEGRSLRSDLHEVAGARPERAFNVGAVLGIVLTVAAVVFVVQNSGATDFEFLWFDFSLPLWTVLVGTLAVGVLLTLAAFGLHRRRRRRIGRREEATGRLERALTTDDPDPEPATEPHRRRFRFPGRRPTPA